MSTTFEPMAPGADIVFSIDFAGKIPPSASLVGAAVNMRSGASSVTIPAPTISGTKVVLRILATTPGLVTFDVLGTFSDTTDDAEPVQVWVK